MKRIFSLLLLLAAMPLAVSADVLPGDVDGSGWVNIADVTELIDLLMSNQNDVALFPAADVNGNGAIGIDDVVELIDVILNTKEHEWVDLGLPSGTLWATCNVGAESPEEYGDYFAWGETEPKDNYNWKTYKWCNGSGNTLMKYCTTSNYGYNGFVDNKTELDPEDDAAYVNWGPSWRMPSQEQIEELYHNCTIEWTLNGLLVKGPNGNSIFLPAGGNGSNGSIYLVGSVGLYWSRSLYGDGFNSFNACCLRFASEYMMWNDEIRYLGCTVRAVRVSPN